MGHSARRQNVSYLLAALGNALGEQGAAIDVDAGLAAMSERF
jgi:alanine-glyoxylate transaminase/serine-glyoxylate transaminase/serine-pyruvate transaminase